MRKDHVVLDLFKKHSVTLFLGENSDTVGIK